MDKTKLCLALSTNTFHFVKCMSRAYAYDIIVRALKAFADAYIVKQISFTVTKSVYLVLL